MLFSPKLKCKFFEKTKSLQLALYCISKQHIALRMISLNTYLLNYENKIFPMTWLIVFYVSDCV